MGYSLCGRQMSFTLPELIFYTLALGKIHHHTNQSPEFTFFIKQKIALLCRLTSRLIREQQAIILQVKGYSLLLNF
jgi:hypothetical protein